MDFNLTLSYLLSDKIKVACRPNYCTYPKFGNDLSMTERDFRFDLGLLFLL